MLSAYVRVEGWFPFPFVNARSLEMGPDWVAFDVSVEICKHFGWVEIPIERLKGEQAVRFGVAR